MGSVTDHWSSDCRLQICSHHGVASGQTSDCHWSDDHQIQLSCNQWLCDSWSCTGAHQRKGRWLSKICTCLYQYIPSVPNNPNSWCLTLLTAVPCVHHRWAQNFIHSASPQDMNFVMVKDTFLLEHGLMKDELDCRAGLKEVLGITFIGEPSLHDQSKLTAPWMHPPACSINNFKGKHAAQKFPLWNKVLSEPLMLPQVRIPQPPLPVLWENFYSKFFDLILSYHCLVMWALYYLI